LTRSSLRIELQPGSPLLLAISARSFQVCVLSVAVVIKGPDLRYSQRGRRTSHTHCLIRWLVAPSMTICTVPTQGKSKGIYPRRKLFVIAACGISQLPAAKRVRWIQRTYEPRTLRACSQQDSQAFGGSLFRFRRQPKCGGKSFCQVGLRPPASRSLDNFLTLINRRYKRNRETTRKKCLSLATGRLILPQGDGFGQRSALISRAKWPPSR
jgi:hypothetical protein